MYSKENIPNSSFFGTDSIRFWYGRNISNIEPKTMINILLKLSYYV
jgi:hypothetical protein